MSAATAAARVLVRAGAGGRLHAGLAAALARVRRFQRVIHTLARGDAPPSAELALACGYYDQSHFIHDFSEFAGLAPTAYAPTAPHAANHVALPD